MANIRSDLGYYEYNRDVLNLLNMRTIALDDAVIKELTAFRALSTLVNEPANLTAVQTTVPFDTMTGNVANMGYICIDTEIIQYTGVSWGLAGVGTLTGCKRGFWGTTAAIHLNNAPIYFGSAFSVVGVGGITDIVLTIPFTGLCFNDSIPESGVIRIQNELIWYGGVTFTDVGKTAGTFNYCFRGYDGTTAAAHAAGLAIAVEARMTSREKVAIINYSSSTFSLYVGYNPTITRGGTNAMQLDYGVLNVFDLDSNARLYGILSVGGTGDILIAEYR